MCDFASCRRRVSAAYEPPVTSHMHAGREDPGRPNVGISDGTAPIHPPALNGATFSFQHSTDELARSPGHPELTGEQRLTRSYGLSSI